ncbi:MAG: hypothetical protein K0M63_00015 [Weeksellaceae bacterium]|nr:hypothetical protein [Weeksellaceae bacterium]
MNFKQILTSNFLLFCSLIFGQQNIHYQNGEKIINEKIEKYHKIDALDYYSPVKATLENRTLDFEVYRNEGEMTVRNVEKQIFGNGGMSVYKFVNKETKKLLKIEYYQTKHLYSDQNLKRYLNSEIQKISIFFDENNKPDFAKILENQYTSEKVISSQIYYLNLSEENAYYKSSESEKLIKYIFQIVTDYK